ncbi:MAG: PEP-utilizing enzyme [Actinomycetota bacterium]
MVDKWMVETALSEQYPFYTRANVGEVFPDPVVPLSFSFAFQDETKLGGSEIGFRRAYERIGVMEASEFPPDECLFLGVVGGYAYLNASALRMLGHRAPGMTYKDIDDAFFGDAPGVPEFVARPGDDRPDLTEKIGATFNWALTTDGLPDVAAFEELVNRLRAERPDYGAMGDRELLDHVWALLDAHFCDLFTEHIYISFLATLPIGIITKVCEAVGQPESTLKLLAGLGDVESAAPSMAMWELGRTVASSPMLTSMFDAGTAGLDAGLRASDDPAAVEFCTGFDRFLFAYGSRGPNEWEVKSPTWETDPDLALAAIDRMRLAPDDAAPNLNNMARAAEREAIGSALVEALAADPETQGQFAAALASAKVFMPGRERTKTNCIKLIQECRVASREFGRRQAEAGLLPDDTAQAFMTRDEQYRYLDDPTGWAETVTARRAHYDQVAALQEPFLFVGSPEPMAEYPRRDAVQVTPVGSGDTLQGVPGCPGSATGRARVITDSHDPTALNPGDILVAPITDPSWTPLFVPAGAVVVDVGAPLSHAIIVSRELGIPCVVSATDATRRIPDGSLIQVDGDTGLVTVLEGPDGP